MSYGFHIPVDTGNADVQMFIGDCQAVNIFSQQWRKPRGKTMANIVLIGAGGNGGTGVIGANSVSAGGAGGQSGCTTIVTVPLIHLPDVLYLALAGRKPTATANFSSKIAISTKGTANDILVIASGGLHGGNASAGTGGTVGTAATIATASVMCLGWTFLQGTPLASQLGTAGGAAGGAASITLPITGAFVTGGTGGGGLPAAAAAGTSGGAILTAGSFPSLTGGVGSATATVPADFGKAGLQRILNTLYNYGGTGGASTHGTATGGGLVQSNGGDGAPGCGGGGMGGALTGSSAGRVGFGGPAFCIITCW